MLQFSTVQYLKNMFKTSIYLYANSFTERRAYL